MININEFNMISNEIISDMFGEISHNSYNLNNIHTSESSDDNVEISDDMLIEKIISYGSKNISNISDDVLNDTCAYSKEIF